VFGRIRAVLIFSPSFLFFARLWFFVFFVVHRTVTWLPQAPNINFSTKRGRDHLSPPFAPFNMTFFMDIVKPSMPIGKGTDIRTRISQSSIISAQTVTTEQEFTGCQTDIVLTLLPLVIIFCIPYWSWKRNLLFTDHSGTSDIGHLLEKTIFGLLFTVLGRRRRRWHLFSDQKWFFCVFCLFFVFFVCFFVFSPYQTPPQSFPLPLYRWSLQQSDVPRNHRLSQKVHHTHRHSLS